jgi:hypothetical protein
MEKDIQRHLRELLVLYKEDILSSVISIVIVAFLLWGYQYISNYFIGALWLGIAFPILLSFVVIMIKAGFVVLESLFLVSAELSLLIFLSQSYCSTPVRGAVNDAALKNLLIVGVIYMALKSFGALRDALRKNFDSIKKGKRLWHEVVVMVSFLFFSLLMVWQIYLVMYPIVVNLCIFR